MRIRKTQSIASSFLASVSDEESALPVADKKSDFAIVFDVESSRVSALRQIVASPNSIDAIRLSQMQDIFTPSVLIKKSIGIKRAGGGKEAVEFYSVTFIASGFR